MMGVLSKYDGLNSLGFKEREILEYKNANNEFTLKDILQRENEGYWRSFLTQLNTNVKVTTHLFPSKKKVRQKISSAPFSTAWELEFAAHCTSQGIKITPEEKTRGSSNVDFQVFLANSEVLVEAHIRRVKDKELTHVGAADITRNLAEAMDRKEEANDIGEDIEKPLIIAIDGNYAGIDIINATSFLERSGKKYPLISGIFLKHRGTYHLIANAKANHKLTEKQRKELIGENG